MWSLVRRIAAVGRSWLLPVLAVAAPAAFLVWLYGQTEERLEVVDPPHEPVVAEATVRRVSDERIVTATLTWEPGQTIVAPPAAGTVTAVHVAPGEELTTGRAVYAVDGIDRIAAATGRPFHRSLRSRDRGPDVTELERLLNRLGLYEGDIDATYGPGVRTAVRALEEQLGVARPSGVFSPELVVWLPAEGFVVDRIEARVASPAPSAGNPLLVGPARLLRAEVAGTSDAPLELAADTEYVLEVSGEAFPIRPGARQIEAGHLDRLAAAVPTGTASVDGTVRRRVVAEVIAVPPGAVMTSESGMLCVWTPDGAGYAPVPVSVVGGGVGYTEIGDGLAPGADVLANPAQVLPVPTCP